MAEAIKLSSSLADDLHALLKDLDPNFDAWLHRNPASTARFNRLYQALSRLDDSKNMTYRPGKRR